MTTSIFSSDIPLMEKVESQVKTEYTVSELAFSLRKTVETHYQFVKVRGEISGAKYHGSGHLYFALKDTEAVIDAVCWRPIVVKLSHALEDGMDVICTGKITTYPGRSKYQIVVDSVTLAGQGALLKLLEERKQRLKAEGLFDLMRKKSLPFLPRVIGIVTSPTGAVIRDILHRLEDRFPRHILLWPVAVQGEGAAQQIAKAIEGFNQLPSHFPQPDLLIIARGGGSLEDLWAFNEENVVRATAASAIPTIAAIGHETDHTLIDLAADIRMPTPSAAAEKAVPVRSHLWTMIQDYSKRLHTSIDYHLRQKNLQLRLLDKSLPDISWFIGEKTQRFHEWVDRFEKIVSFRFEFYQSVIANQSQSLKTPHVFLRLKQETLDQIYSRFYRSVCHIFESYGNQWLGLTSLFYSLSPDRILERGYAIALTPGTKKPITRKADFAGLFSAELKFRDGTVTVYTNPVPTKKTISTDISAPSNPEKPQRKKPDSDLFQNKLW